MAFSIIAVRVVGPRACKQQANRGVLRRRLCDQQSRSDNQRNNLAKVVLIVESGISRIGSLKFLH